jgi:hypothetical protein
MSPFEKNHREARAETPQLMSNAGSHRRDGAGLNTVEVLELMRDGCIPVLF